MGAVEVREAEESDFGDVAELYREGYSGEPYHERWTREDALEKIREYVRREARVFVAEDAGKIVGLIIFGSHLWDKGKKGFVHEVVVARDYQGKGVGRTLMEIAEDMLREEGCYLLELMANKNAEALHFHKHLGFQETNMILLEKEVA